MRLSARGRPLAQGFQEEDFLVVQQRSGLLKPSYFLLRDRAINAIVLLIRGTQTVKVRRAVWGQLGRGAGRCSHPKSNV